MRFSLTSGSGESSLLTRNVIGAAAYLAVFAGRSAMPALRQLPPRQRATRHKTAPTTVATTAPTVACP
ncbi:hypothetical protein BZL30_9511 [Mycobacterium kansasii]|uniref:Uncharacterized protein n=1 Tax=Mycobacterium kansasii TaxID=1768 RepID=A0A1V3W8W8_MYCKA|nr:hypothetical protein BZL30_9511 [Mycobacterium kansasii]